MKNNHLKKRLKVAIAICESVGQAILKFREISSLPKIKLRSDGQLKSPVDIAAENWIISLLRFYYPNEEILSEEKYTIAKKIIYRDSGYWLVDALDGTRSYHDGYKGFCIQIAFIKNGRPQLAVVHAPAFNATYQAIIGQGAYLKIKKRTRKLFLKKQPLLEKKVYIDNRPAKGKIATILQRLGATEFLEMGSYGLKICKVAEGRADIFLKFEEFKIWDTAPGDLILREAGGKLTLWSGEEIDYSGKKIYFKNLLAASPIYHKKILPYL